MQHVLTGRALDISQVLVVMVGARACAFPLHHVAETMRPLPIEAVVGTPSFVCGVSVIYGVPTTEAHEVARHRVTARMKVDLLNCTNSFLY